MICQYCKKNKELMYGVCRDCRKKRGMQLFGVDEDDEVEEEFRWYELFEYIESEDYDNYCKHELTGVEEFCNDNNLDFTEVKRKLHLAGGFCDCEVILNAKNEIRGNDVMPKRIE